MTKVKDPKKENSSWSLIEPDEDQDNESKIRFHISDQYFSTKNMIVKANIYSDNVYVWYLLDHENQPKLTKRLKKLK